MTLLKNTRTGIYHCADLEHGEYVVRCDNQPKPSNVQIVQRVKIEEFLICRRCLKVWG